MATPHANSMPEPNNLNSNKKKRKINVNDYPAHKKSKLSEDVEEPVETDEVVKKLTSFNVKDFRSKLRSTDGLKYLRDFANCVEWKTTENDIVLEYLSIGGTLSEIISLLDITAQGDLATALPVFRAVYLILLRIQSDANKYGEEAQQSVEHILASFVSTIQSMISMNSPKHRKVVLKLLTAIVTFHSSYGRQILNWFHLTPQQQEQYTEHGAVRKAFIMFLLAFFVDGQFTLFRPLLEKKGLLSAVLPNLKYDDEQTVAVFLTVLKEKLLTNPKVPKTLKLNIFNTQSIQSLFELYDWIGPKGAQKGWKKPRKMAAADEEALSLVTSALNEFLSTLCTCRKNGVVFWDKSLGTGSQMNQVIYTALEIIPKPWKKTETFNLVVNILKNAPDLIKPCLLRWDSSFKPRESNLWVQSIHFLVEVFKSLECDQISEAALEVLSKHQLQMTLRSLFLSPSILKHIKTGLSSDNSIAIRSHCLRLLTTIIIKLTQILNTILSNASSDISKKNIIYPLHAVVPEVKAISEMWQLTAPEISSSIQPLEAIDEICANLVLAVAQLDNSLFDNPRRLCKALLHNIDEKNSKVQSAVLQAISLLEPTFLTPQSEQFESALGILLLLSSEANTRTGSLSALFAMLLNTGLWDYRVQELDCWLGVWLRVKPSTREIVAKIFINAVVRASQSQNYGENLFVYLELIKVCDEMKNELNKMQKIEVKTFITDLSLQLGCFSETNCQTLAKNNKLLLLDVQTCLLGDLMQAALIQNSRDRKYVLWLLGDDDKLFEASTDADSFELFSLLNFSVHFLREWLKQNNFTELRQNRCLNGIKLILEDACSKTSILEEKEINFISMNPSSRTFLVKALETIFSDLSLLGEFNIIDENIYTSWLKKLIISLELPKKIVDINLLLPWKANLMLQLRKILKIKKETTLPSADLYFWLSFVRPSINDLTSLLTNLNAASAGNIVQSAGSEAFGAIWLATLRVLGKQNAPHPLISDIVRCLCKVALVPQCKPDNVDALLELFRNFPLAILDVSKDFFKVLLGKQELSSSLIEIASLCVQKQFKKKIFISILCNSLHSININAAISIIDNLHRQYAKKMNGDASENYLSKIDKRLPKLMPGLAKRLWKPLRSYINGNESDEFSQHLPIIRFLIADLGCKEKKVKKIIKALNGNHPKVDVFTEVALIVQKIDNDLLSIWLQQLCQEALITKEWVKQNGVIQTLVKDKHFHRNFVALKDSKIWKTFLKFTLRNLKVTSEIFQLNCIAVVLETGYSEQDDNEHLADIFHKLTSHSEFMPIMLSDAPIKEELVNLLLVLVRLRPQVMLLGHIPLYLSAYHGSLSSCDQKLLQIFKQYEQHCGSLSKFDPLFWGPPAVSYYSIKGNAGLSLWKQVTMKSVLEILNLEKIKQTIADFPIDRQLKGGEVNSMNNIYDPAFLLPLFSNLFSPGAVSYCLSFIHKGALSLTIAALSSTDSNMRGVAAVVLSRFYSHLQLVQHFKQKPVWLHFLDCVRFGCENMETTPISGVVTVFLARAVLEVSDPQSHLYSLHRFLIAKPVFNLRMLPELFSLFYSDDLNYVAHRKWILEVLRDGIKVSNDAILALKSSAFKLCLTSFTLPTTSFEIKVLILQIIQKIICLDKVPETIVLELGLLSWLRLVCKSIQEPLVPSFISLFQALIQYFYKIERRQGRIGRKFRLLHECETALGGYLSNVGKLEAAVNIISLLEKS